MYLPRGVDGPEIIQHRNIRIDGPVSILRSGNTIEVFVGGRALSYRLLGSALVAKKDDCKSWDIGMYVEDGSVQYSDFKVTEGMGY
jgi:beta-fructofuranosidase